MNGPLADEELMLRVRDGAAEELGVLFERYHVPLFNFFCRLTNDRARSEDLVQEAFYRILKYRRTYQAGCPFRPWMYRIARSARSDSYRKQQDEVDLKAAPVQAVLPIDTVHDEQQAALLKQALMQLPEDRRELLVLARFQEMKYGEIAALVECPVATLKVRIHRALQQLKQNFRLLEGQARSGRERPEEGLGR